MKSNHSRFKRKWGERKWRKLLRNFFVKEGRKIMKEKIALIKSCVLFFCFFILRWEKQSLLAFRWE